MAQMGLCRWYVLIDGFSYGTVTLAIDWNDGTFELIGHRPMRCLRVKNGRFYSFDETDLDWATFFSLAESKWVEVGDVVTLTLQTWDGKHSVSHRMRLAEMDELADDYLGPHTKLWYRFMPIG